MAPIHPPIHTHTPKTPTQQTHTHTHTRPRTHAPRNSGTSCCSCETSGADAVLGGRLWATSGHPLDGTREQQQPRPSPAAVMHGHVVRGRLRRWAPGSAPSGPRSAQQKQESDQGRDSRALPAPPVLVSEEAGGGGQRSIKGPTGPVLAVWPGGRPADEIWNRIERDTELPRSLSAQLLSDQAASAIGNWRNASLFSQWTPGQGCSQGAGTAPRDGAITGARPRHTSGAHQPLIRFGEG